MRRHPRPNEGLLERWRRGFAVPGLGCTAPWSLEWEGQSSGWLRIVMHEGKKRQIREVAAHLGLEVVQLVRVRIGSLELGDLARGNWRALQTDEVEALRAEAGLPALETMGPREKG